MYIYPTGNLAIDAVAIVPYGEWIRLEELKSQGHLWCKLLWALLRYRGPSLKAGLWICATEGKTAQWIKIKGTWKGHWIMMVLLLVIIRWTYCDIGFESSDGLLDWLTDHNTF